MLGYTSRAYFKASKNQISKETKIAEAVEFILAQVKIERKKMAKIGGLKLFYKISPLLKSAGFKIGRDKFMDILDEHNLVCLPQAEA